MESRREFIRRAGVATGISLLAPGASHSEVPIAPQSFPESVRTQLLVPSQKLYLNTGSLGPSPRSVINAVTEAMQQLESDPVTMNWGKLGDQMEEVRKKVAQFIHSDIEEVLLTRNTTEGLGLICQSLALNPGDEIITTTLEHGGGEVGLEFLEKTRGAVIRRVELPIPPDDVTEIVKRLTAAITSKTRLMMVSHVNTITGLLMPISEISAAIRGRGIFHLVDGAQAPGLTPVDVRTLGVDAYATSGHKWLLAPKETGFLYVNKEAQKGVQPLFAFSGYGSYSKSSGTRNVALLIGLGAAIDWHQAIGKETIRSHSLDVKDYCQSELRRIPGLHILSPSRPELSTGIVSFELLKAKNSEVYTRLVEKEIVVKVLPQHNAIRISCHAFVSRPDIDRFISALRPLV